jgi:hypothetical protein
MHRACVYFRTVSDRSFNISGFIFTAIKNKQQAKSKKQKQNAVASKLPFDNCQFIVVDFHHD